MYSERWDWEYLVADVLCKLLENREIDLYVCKDGSASESVWTVPLDSSNESEAYKRTFQRILRGLSPSPDIQVCTRLLRDPTIVYLEKTTDETQ